jgi:preprotein translocase subunit SecD
MPPALENPYLQWLVLTAAVWGLSQAFLRKELRLRATLFGAILIASGVALWPPYDSPDRPGKIRLGLDLRGGTHLVLRVVTDDALKAVVDDAVQNLRSQLSQKGISFGIIQRIDTRTLGVDGIEPARVADVEDILDDLGRDWETRRAGQGELRASMTSLYARQIEERTVDEAMRTLERRVNELGVAEPVIARHGDVGDQILVQLPGLSDVEQAKRIIERTAQLSLKLVENVAASREALLEGSVEPPGMEIVPGVRGSAEGELLHYLLRREAVVTGRDLKNARVTVDEFNAPAIGFTMNPQGADKLRRATGENIGRQLAIVLDGRVESAPEIRGRISDSGQITGRFSAEEADELSRVLRAGALPATLEYLQELSVGASLGRDSIRAGVTASLVGLAAICLFMLAYYRLSGVNAIVALLANLLILTGIMAGIEATLTLPGIAGVILTVGVGVDTNVLILERIREELRTGKTVKAAIANGFERVFYTILDTHATALIAAALLFQFGTGPIKGFAVTLFIGLGANVVASFFLSRFLFEWILGKRPAQLSI